MKVITQYLKNELQSLLAEKQKVSKSDLGYHAKTGQEIKFLEKHIMKADMVEGGAVQYLGEDVGQNIPSTDAEDVQYFKGYHQGVQDGKRMR